VAALGEHRVLVRGEQGPARGGLLLAQPEAEEVPEPHLEPRVLQAGLRDELDAELVVDGQDERLAVEREVETPADLEARAADREAEIPLGPSVRVLLSHRESGLHEPAEADVEALDAPLRERLVEDGHAERSGGGEQGDERRDEEAVHG
jgi:hypothetical protein